MRTFAQTGDKQAFTELMKRHKARAYRYCLTILRDHDEAMDASQDGFMRVFQARKTFQLDRPFNPWFHRILRNCALGRVRQTKRRRKAGDDELLVAQAAGPDCDPQKRAEALQLLQALSGLSPAHQEILALRCVDGLSYEQIAQRLEIPKGTVMSRLYHAREALRKKHGL
ncbi:MAG: RNA polymerase sigma factor [Candidatus Alcyoniella australis]|nr:RNA polymerase sigma factor [Candidatus Alcyoniella australis]